VTKTNPARRNDTLGVYRFIFAIVVCLSHFHSKGNFGPDGPALFVEANAVLEFFSISSGYFLMRDAVRAWGTLDCGEAGAAGLTGKYALRRFTRLFPHFFLTFSVFILLRILLLHTLTPQDAAVQGFFELFLLQGFGFPSVTLLYWFVSTLFIASVLLYWLALVLREHFVLLMAFTAPLTYSVFYWTNGSIGLTLEPAVAGTVGLWRMAAGLGMGALVYHAVQYLKPRLAGRFPLLSSLLELGLTTFLLVIFYFTHGDHRDFPMVFLFALLLTSLFLGGSSLSRLLDNPVSGFLGKISYGFYLNQAIFVHLFGPVIPVGKYWPSAALYLLLNFLLSVLTTWLCQWAMARIQPRCARISQRAAELRRAAPPAEGRNRTIGAYRFLFAVLICLFHFRAKGSFGSNPCAFRGGWLGVEFFALASGFFLMHSIEKARAGKLERGELLPAVGSFALRRYLRLYPHYILTLVPFLLMRIFLLHTLSVRDCLTDGFFDFFMLQAFGFSSVVYMLWYPSALFLGCVLLYWLSLVLKDHYLVVMAFAAPLILASFLHNYGNLDQTMYNAIVGSRGLWRMIAELGLGCLIYQAVKYWKPFLQNRFGLAASVLELALLAAVLVLCWQGTRDSRDFIALGLLGLLVLSVFLGNSRLSRLLDNPLSDFLGKISYGFYLNQAFFIHLYGDLLPVNGYWRTAAVFLSCNLVLSVASYFLSQKLSALLEGAVRRLQTPA